MFGPNSVNVARYASLIGTKSPTKWNAQLTESNFQTRPSNSPQTHTPGGRVPPPPAHTDSLYPLHPGPSSSTSERIWLYAGESAD
ncbi:DUF6783 domain-containing protein [Enterocloster sp. OA13]|uniref:DUF6783 domain-containing protein n=1 Tax=Enterocloster sp. OA13 TaxID=2914161 RepID=UPI00336BB69D